MRHNVTGRKFNRTKSHKDAMLANMTASLLEHKKLHTTEAKAKELRPFAEAIITKAKHALAREKQNLLPAGQTLDIHNRRLVYKIIRNKGVIQELFDAIAPVVEARNGGYCRITKTGTRRGDAARTAIIELVDWSAPVDGAVNNQKRKKSASKNITKKASTTEEKIKTAPVEEKIDSPVIEASVETAKEEVIETLAPATEEVATSTEETTEAPVAKEAVIEEVPTPSNEEKIEAKEVAFESVAPATEEVAPPSDETETTEKEKDNV